MPLTIPDILFLVIYALFLAHALRIGFRKLEHGSKLLFVVLGVVAISKIIRIFVGGTESMVFILASVVVFALVLVFGRLKKA